MKHFKYRFGLTPMFVGTLWLFLGQSIEQKQKLDSLKDISGIPRERFGLAERLIFLTRYDTMQIAYFYLTYVNL